MVRSVGHNYESYTELLYVVTDEYEVRPSPFALLGVQRLLQALSRFDEPMREAAFHRACAVLQAFPELYGSDSFERMLAFWVRVDALVLSDYGFSRRQRPVFGAKGHVSDAVDFSAWQRALADVLSHVGSHNTTARLQTAESFLRLCEAMWTMQQDVFVRQQAGLLFN